MNSPVNTTPFMIDPFGRRIEYLRLSVTDQCNLRCFYCMPKKFKDFKEPESWLTFAEIEKILSNMAEMGLKRVRLTGGEPLVRKNLPELIEIISGIKGIEDISMSTNAIGLDKYANTFAQAGLKRINVSLDSLDPETFKTITRGPLDKVLDGLLAAKEAGISPIKINMVPMKGINLHQIPQMIEFCMQHDFVLRLIEVMPMGDTGRKASEHFVDLNDVRLSLEQQYQFTPAIAKEGGPARYLHINGTQHKIGFITPMTQHFCASCNRIRMGVDGTLYLCLGQNDSYALRDLLRSGIDQKELKTHLMNALKLKPERHFFKEKPDQIIRIMSVTGG